MRVRSSLYVLIYKKTNICIQWLLQSTVGVNIYEKKNVFLSLNFTCAWLQKIQKIIPLFNRHIKHILFQSISQVHSI